MIVDLSPYCVTASSAYPLDRTFTITIASDTWPLGVSLLQDLQDDNSLKARRRRFQEFTRSLHREAPFHGIRPAVAKGRMKHGARAREQRDRKTLP